MSAFDFDTIHSIRSGVDFSSWTDLASDCFSNPVEIGSAETHWHHDRPDREKFSMNLCPNCKSPIPPEVNRFCNQCGVEIAGGQRPIEPKPVEPVEAARLIGILLTGEKTEYCLDRAEMAIGKAGHNQIVLEDPTVSGSHALIIFGDGGFNLLDLASSNGTWINGERLANRSHRLCHGDRIRIGRLTLTFRDPNVESTNRTVELTRAGLGNVDNSGQIKKSVASERTITVNLPPDLRQAMANESAGPPGLRPAGLRPPGLRPAGLRPAKRRGNRLRTRMAVLNSASRIISTIIGSMLTIGLVLFLTRQAQQSSQNQLPTISATKTSGPTSGPNWAIVAEGTWRPFSTGLLAEKLEASGVTLRPGSSELILAGDRHADRLFRVTLDEAGLPAGEPLPFPVLNPAEPSGTFSDPEALTYGNGFFYLLCSQSDPVDTRQHRLLRFDLDPVTHLTRGPVEVIGNLRDLLLNGIPEIATIGARPGSVGGLNAEGLAWDPNHERLIVGLRSPLIGDQAILVPLKMREPNGPFESANLALSNPSIMLLPLGGQGIRDLTYDPRLKSFLILSGPSENRPEDNFGLWEWSGRPESRPTRLFLLEAEMRPEAILSLSVGQVDFLIITGDNGHYLKLGYRETP